ncbi:MAG: hypothetical protein U0165_04355 [Polyangiaceae bacterium]
MYEKSAELVRAIASRWGMGPQGDGTHLDRSVLVGHQEIPNGNLIAESSPPCPDSPSSCVADDNYGGAGNHRDPGVYWEWCQYMHIIGQNASCKCDDAYSLYNCVHDGSAMVRCSDGSTIDYVECSGGCTVQPVGVNDECVGVATGGASGAGGVGGASGSAGVSGSSGSSGNAGASGSSSAGASGASGSAGASGTSGTAATGGATACESNCVTIVDAGNHDDQSGGCALAGTRSSQGRALSWISLSALVSLAARISRRRRRA